MSPIRYMVFVYGTLKRNQPNNPFMLDLENGFSEFLCTAKTVNKWPLVIASQFNIPYLLRKQHTGNQIFGEIYLVDQKMLNFLDHFEGHPKYYTRLETSVVDENQRQLTPWIYFINQYKPEMLERTMYTNYDSYGDHGMRYVERCDPRRSLELKKDNHAEVSEIKLY